MSVTLEALELDSAEVEVLGTCSLSSCVSAATQACDISGVVIDDRIMLDEVKLCAQHAFEHLAAESLVALPI